MRKQGFKITSIVLGLFFVGLMPSCDEAALNDILDTFINEFYDVGFGWQGDTENLGEIEDDINLGIGSGQIPASVDLRSKFPPIGNQGQYGTCVAWAVGYNLKTYLEAVDKQYSSSDLSQPSKQFSPKDLFWSISNSDKGADCNGTGFAPAFDVIQERGIATLATVPYDDLGDCSSSPPSTWTSEANEYKIESYRQIDVTEDNLKGYLADNRAIAIGAALGENFMSWNTDDVLTSDTDTYNGQHAYHAMTLAGYDDDRGPRGAFLVVNSWGTSWGSSGYIWVDYDFFVSDFCFAAFVATNTESDPSGGDDPVEGYDLTSWNLSDEPNGGNERFITYNVYNTGENTIYASQNWAITYLLYNAYDANDYEILVFDYYTEDYGDNDRHYDPIPDGDEMAIGQVNWWNNIDIPGGASVASTLIPGAENFSFSYTIPTDINGSYYMALISDAFDAIEEYDEGNNYLFFEADGGDPFEIVNGVVQNEPYATSTKSAGVPGLYAKSPNPTLVKDNNLNTYSPEELSRMLQHHRETGEFQRRVNQFIQNQNNKAASK